MDSISSIMDEFQHNGLTKDLDEFDLLKLECRRKRNILQVSAPSYVQLMESVDKVRLTLYKQRPLGGKQHCVFCKKNNEKPEVFSTHTIRNDDGMVTCPILQKYLCPLCGATGKEAHTMKYCPLYDGIITTGAVLTTPRNSAGKRNGPRQLVRKINT